MKRLSTLFILYTLFAVNVISQPSYVPRQLFDDVPPPKREVRATWIATIGGIDWPSSYAQNTTSSIERQKDELRSMLDRLQMAGINIVLLQTRVRGTTIYPSKIEPWDGCLSGKPGVSPGYDALAFAVEECHKRGMELHSWVVTIPVGKWNGLGCQRLRKRYPKLVKKIGQDGYLNPEDPQTAKVIAEVCEEIVKNYDVDGIHLDYIRYPEDWKITVSRSKGRDNITRIARTVSERVKALKPWVKMSCSPIGKADDLPRQSSRGWNAYSRVCQDAQGWLRDGVMDMLFPMMYFKGENFYPFLFDWQQSANKPVVPGLGLYFMSEKEKNWPLDVITQEMEVARQLGMGHCMYRARFFLDNTKGIYDFTQRVFNAVPALVPALGGGKCPLSPEELRIDSLTSVLSWNAVASGGRSDEYITYNIYSSTDWPVDVDDARNIMRTRLDATSLLVPLSGAYYAVTAMDRYGNESEPAQLSLPKGQEPSAKFVPAPGLQLVPNDGLTLAIGERLRKTDIVLIQTLQGQTLLSVLADDEISIKSLPEGIYQIRLLGKSNLAHRLGYFMIKPRLKP